MSATQRFIRSLFGNLGTRTAVPDLTQGDGSLSYEQGYGPDYQRVKTDPLAKNIERDKMNQLFYDFSLNQRQYQIFGVPEYVPAADNGGVAVAYPVDARVLYNGVVYLSLVAANNVLPDSDVTKWARQTSRGLARFTANGTFTVPLNVTTLYVSAVSGGGGGGAGGSASGTIIGGGGCGGGAGQSVIRTAYTVVPGTAIAITVGAAGAGGAATAGASGAAGTGGGNTVVGALVTLIGGRAGGGGSSTVSPATGGSPTGTSWPAGGAGGDATSNTATGNGGLGASGPFGGGGGNGRSTASSTTPLAAIGADGFGAGGGGGGGVYSVGGGIGGAGGGGAPGLVLIEW